MLLPTISFDKILTDTCPDVRLGVLLINIKNAPSGEDLLKAIQETLDETSASLSTEDISSIPPLHATRQAYKALGKDPSRYRPSAEALLRRVVKGKGLYHVNNVVDTLNLISVKSGFSIGGYDFEKIKGGVRLGRGEVDEPYQAIGRGALNIEGLPILRDKEGAFGSPTSDSTRTMVTDKTKVFLAIVFDFAPKESLCEKNEALGKALTDLEDLLVTHAHGKKLGNVVLGY